MGQSPSSKNYTENPEDMVLIQGNADLSNGKIKPRLFTTEITKKSIKNDIILTVRAPVGDLAINEHDACIGRGVCAIRSGNNKFVYYLLENIKRKHIWERLSQGSTFESINSDDIKNLKINIPSLLEQYKIANFLTKIDEKIDLLEKTLVQYEKYLNESISKFTKKENNMWIPKEKWKKFKIRDLLKEFNQKTETNNQYPLLSSTKEKIILQEDYFNKQIASKDNTGYKILLKNQIVLSPQNLWLGNINLNEEFEIGIVSPSYKIYDIKEKIDKNYLKFIIKTPRMLYLYATISEQGASVVRRNLNQKLFNELIIELPPIKDQKIIADFLNSISLKISLIEVKIEKNKEFKKFLLQNMFV